MDNHINQTRPPRCLREAGIRDVIGDIFHVAGMIFCCSDAERVFHLITLLPVETTSSSAHHLYHNP